MKEPGVLAAGAGEPAGFALERRQFGDDGFGLVRPAVAVGLDVAGGEDMGVGVQVIGVDGEAFALEGMAHARRATEQVADGSPVRQQTAGCPDDVSQQGAL